MAIKIGKKIKSYSVAGADDKKVEAIKAAEPDEHIEIPKAEVIQMHERIERPDELLGSTYKIKSPLFEHALYVTINDIVLNKGTENEMHRPFEIFINSKNMDHFQWIVALTRIMSAVFRKGGDVIFLVEEMKAVFDPRGGYFKAGGTYMPSIVAEIGAVVEDHLKQIGMIVSEDLTPEQKRLIAEKRAAYDERSKKKTSPDLSQGSSPRKRGSSDSSSASDSSASDSSSISADMAGAGGESARHDDDTLTITTAAMADDAKSANGSFPPSATLCQKCSTKAVIIMDGCATCLNCGYSKCG
jgi:hypothetical protein